MIAAVRAFTVVLFFGTFIQAATAQVVPDSLTSRRIRVHLEPIDRSREGYWFAPIVRGTLLQVTTDSVKVHLHEAAAPVSIASTGIRQIDPQPGVSRTRTALSRGLLWGLTWYGLSAMRDDGSGPLWGGGGFVLGATIGAIFPEERWKRVYRK